MLVFLYIVFTISGVLFQFLALASETKGKYYAFSVIGLIPALINFIFCLTSAISRVFIVNLLLALLSLAIIGFACLILFTGFSPSKPGNVKEVPEEEVPQYESQFQPESPATMKQNVYGYTIQGAVPAAQQDLPQNSTDFSYRFSSPAGTCQVIGRTTDYKIVFEGKEAVEYYVSNDEIVGYKVAEKGKIMQYGG